MDSFLSLLVQIHNEIQIFCPLSMTDGSARVIELLGSKAMKEQVLPRLISRDPSYAFTAGQWMTEVNMADFFVKFSPNSLIKLSAT